MLTYNGQVTCISHLMQAQEHIHKLLKTAAIHQLSYQDEEALEKIGLETFITRRLFSKKFRKWKLDPACIERTTQAVAAKISANEPIAVVYPQGGYKLWRLPSSPRADWAEFFVMAYVLEYVAPIAAAYQPGVKVVFYLHTLLMELHDNLTTEEIAAYGDSLQAIITAFQAYCPTNITIEILRDADIYSREEYSVAIEAGREQAVAEFAKWPPERKANYARMAKLNIKWQGRERWDLLTEPEKQDKLNQAALYEIAGTQNLPRVSEKVKSPHNVLVFTKPTPDFIGIGSTHSSVAKYWVGYGVLENDGRRFFERVLSPSQWENCKKTEYHTENIALPNLEFLPELCVFPRLDFSKA
jgi:hypothetical protein